MLPPLGRCSVWRLLVASYRWISGTWPVVTGLFVDRMHFFVEPFVASVVWLLYFIVYDKVLRAWADRGGCWAMVAGLRFSMGWTPRPRSWSWQGGCRSHRACAARASSQRHRHGGLALLARRSYERWRTQLLHTRGICEPLSPG